MNGPFRFHWRELGKEIATGIERFRRSIVLYGRGSVRPGPEPSEKCAVNKVLIGRYIAFVGSLLLAILFIADWCMPMAPTLSVTSRGADKPIIRIKSDRKWPERIVFDTSAPTIVPQMPPVVADAPVTNPPREAPPDTGASSFKDTAAG